MSAIERLETCIKVHQSFIDNAIKTIDNANFKRLNGNDDERREAEIEYDSGVRSKREAEIAIRTLKHAIDIVQDEEIQRLEEDYNFYNYCKEVGAEELPI